MYILIYNYHFLEFPLNNYIVYILNFKINIKL